MNISNYNQLTDKIRDFDWHLVSWIYEFHYHIIVDEFCDNIFVLDLGVLIKSIDGVQYRAKLRFSRVNSVNLYLSGALFQTILFEIVDIKEDGWCDANYLIRDIERDDLRFLCKDIEVISVEECNFKSYGVE